jgi:two-component system, response regulator YesN
VNVLFVDDEPIVFEQLEFILRPLFPLWNYYFASDSSQAVALTKEHHFDLALVDIELPGKSGLELVKDLKEIKESLQIIILSAHQDFQYAKKSIQLGVAEYLTKPIIEEELIETIKRFSSAIFNMQFSKLINDALTIIHETFEQRVTLLEIASRVHTSPAYLSRKFSEEVGMSLIDYLTEYRIEKAKHLLAYTNQSISAIAEKTGFNSLHYFSTQFKKKENITPKQYREHYDGQ